MVLHLMVTESCGSVGSGSRCVMITRTWFWCQCSRFNFNCCFFTSMLCILLAVACSALMTSHLVMVVPPPTPDISSLFFLVDLVPL